MRWMCQCRLDATISLHKRTIKLWMPTLQKCRALKLLPLDKNDDNNNNNNNNNNKTNKKTKQQQQQQQKPPKLLFNHHHLFLNCEGRWGTTDDFTTNFLHFPLFSTALWDSAISRPVHSLMLSSHLLLCPPCLLSPFTVPCKMVLARPDEGETWQYHCSVRLFTMVRRSSCSPLACWILAWTSSLVTWSFY